MDEHVAESEIEHMDLDNKVDNHCNVVCSKMKHGAKATENEGFYNPLDPRV